MRNGRRRRAGSAGTPAAAPRVVRPARVVSGYRDGAAAVAVELVERAEEALQAAMRAEDRESACREIKGALLLLAGLPERIWALTARDR